MKTGGVWYEDCKLVGVRDVGDESVVLLDFEGTGSSGERAYISDISVTLDKQLLDEFKIGENVKVKLEMTPKE